MKIAVFHHSFVSGTNGAERFSYLVARALNALLYTVYYSPEIEIYLPGIKDMLRGEWHPYRPRYWCIEDVDLILKALRKDIDADFIIYSSHYTPYHTLKYHGPYLYYCHTPPRRFYDFKREWQSIIRSQGAVRYYPAVVHSNILMAFDQYLNRVVLNNERVITNSRTTYQRYVKYYNRRPRDYIYPPVETERYYWKEPEGYFFTVSRLEPNKRVDWLIKAAASSKKRLIIAGDGSMRGDLEALSKRLNARVEFLGRVNDTELRDYYSRCNAFLFSGVREDFGLVPVEALASGKPVITVAEGGPMEYLTPDIGFTYHTPEELTAILQRTPTERYIGMRDACERAAKRFDVQVCCDRLREVIDAILRTTGDCDP